MLVQDLTKRYDGKAVVDGVSFAIPKGKVLSLIGPNGAGKSTVMGMISRLIASDAGQVDFGGRPLQKWNSRELSKRLAILTQSNNIQMKLTVRELVNFGRFPYSGSRLTAEDHAKVTRAIDYMELTGMQDQFIDELSGGQRQRAFIAMVIAQDTDRIAALQAAAEGKTAIVGMVNAGGFSLLGNDGRCSLIGREIGFENVGVDADTDTSAHGNEASFEFVLDKNPDYIFAMDRDAAIGTQGAQLAAEVLDNELINKTDAAQNGRVVVLEHSNVWYTAEGGITALRVMLQDLENAMLG